MAVARFQSRPEKLSSTKPRIVRSWSNTATIVSERRAASSRSTSARSKNSAPPSSSTTTSKMVASCQGWPPWAREVIPASWSLPAVALNSSKLVGIAAPTSASTSGLAQIQSTRWTFTGAAT